MSQNKRPLSPFMLGDAYKFQITSVMSFLHRLSGIALVFIMFVIAAWFAGIAAGPDAYQAVQGFLTNWFVLIFVFIGTFAACYHFCNGIRHLFWDAGKGVDMDSARKSARLVQIGAIVLGLIIIVAGFMA